MHPPDDVVIWRHELRQMCGGVCGETIRVWIKRGKLPPPDVKLSLRTMGWRLSTLRAAGFDLPLPPRPPIR
ncbi:MAG: hypothetical protein JWP60_4137 [Ramlibacter sp.]|nr:hypothetical protein [Ramlibacter sp.]